MLFIMCDKELYLFTDNVLWLTAAGLVLIYNTPWVSLVPDALKSRHFARSCLFVILHNVKQAYLLYTLPLLWRLYRLTVSFWKS
jgi:hypothetical protein